MQRWKVRSERQEGKKRKGEEKKGNKKGKVRK